jgi:hypothetical protein
VTKEKVVYYYLFMGLLITTLVLWAIIALREDHPSDDGQKGKSG